MLWPLASDYYLQSSVLAQQQYYNMLTSHWKFVSSFFFFLSCIHFFYNDVGWLEQGWMLFGYRFFPLRRSWCPKILRYMQIPGYCISAIKGLSVPLRSRLKITELSGQDLVRKSLYTMGFKRKKKICICNLNLNLQLELVFFIICIYTLKIAGFTITSCYPNTNQLS